MDHNHDNVDSESTDGRYYHLDARTTEPDMASGTSGDDIFHAITDGTTANQVHLYGAAGKDVFHLGMASTGGKATQHGYHVFAGDGADRINFNDLPELRGTIVGRLDDFDPREDQIWLGDQRLDLKNPQAIKGLDVQIVSYQGQQWLDIKNADGGRAFYTLEGARRAGPNMAGDPEEAHFLPATHRVPKDLAAVAYTDPGNNVDPALLKGYHAHHVIKASDAAAKAPLVKGSDMNDSITLNRGHDAIDGKGGDDLIRAHFGDDTVDGGAGNDIIDGYKGYDLLRGGDGNDTIYGGTDADTIYGGAGHDVLYGGTEDDVLYGDAGDDLIDGGFGNDRLFSGAGRDTLIGGWGDDSLTVQGDYALVKAGEGNDQIFAGSAKVDGYGGLGRDVYSLEKGGILTIHDFDPSADRLKIASHFEDTADLKEFTYAQANASDPKVKDLVIDLPEGGKIVLVGQGEFDDKAHTLLDGWDGTDPDDDPDEKSEEEDPADDADAGGGDDGGDGAGIGLVLALLGGMAALMSGGLAMG